MPRSPLVPIAALLLCSSLVAAPGGSTVQDVQRTGTIEQTEVHLVLIDAVVTDPDGKPMAGLTRERFKLRVDSTNAPIASFEDHCPAEPSRPAPEAAAI